MGSRSKARSPPLLIVRVPGAPCAEADACLPGAAARQQEVLRSNGRLGVWQCLPKTSGEAVELGNGTPCTPTHCTSEAVSRRRNAFLNSKCFCRCPKERAAALSAPYPSHSWRLCGMIGAMFEQAAAAGDAGCVTPHWILRWVVDPLPPAAVAQAIMQEVDIAAEARLLRHTAK
jgi:hypothetical protein